MENIQPSTIIQRNRMRLNGVWVSQALMTILERKFDYSARTQTKAGVQFDMSFEQYLALITISRLQTMEKHLKRGSFMAFMQSNYGYVLTWKGRAERDAGIMNAETAIFTDRETSKRRQQFQKGDKHSDVSKQRISEAKRGQKHSEETKALIAVAKRGQTHTDTTRAKISATKKGRPMSPEHKEKIRAAMLARKAA